MVQVGGQKVTVNVTIDLPTITLLTMYVCIVKRHAHHQYCIYHSTKPFEKPIWLSMGDANKDIFRLIMFNGTYRAQKTVNILVSYIIFKAFCYGKRNSLH